MTFPSQVKPEAPMAAISAAIYSQPIKFNNNWKMDNSNGQFFHLRHGDHGDGQAGRQDGQNDDNPPDSNWNKGKHC